MLRADPDRDVPVRLARQAHLLELLLAEYQSAGSGVDGSSGSIAPGMSAHSSVWKVRTAASSIGYFE